MRWSCSAGSTSLSLARRAGRPVTFLRRRVRLDEPVKPFPTRPATWSICITSLVLVVASGVVYALNGFAPAVIDWGTAYNPIAFVPVTIAFPIVGVLIAVRRPDNAVGWLCLFIGLDNALSGFCGRARAIFVRARFGGIAGRLLRLVLRLELGVWRRFDGGLPAAAFSQRQAAVSPLEYGPVGRRRGHDSRVPGASIWSGAAGASALRHSQPLCARDANALIMVFAFGSVLVPVCFVAAGASMVVRFRRSRGVERQQLKWFVYAAALLAGLFAIEMTILIVRGTTGWGAQRVLEDVVTAAFAAPAIAAGIAILRYRLYDIDILINRTLVYASLTVVLGLVYVVGVVGIGGLLRGITGQSNSLVVAISTMAVAALFRPAQGRIQGSVDRHFYRGKYDAVKTLDGFLARVREEVALDALLDDLIATVQETVQPRHVSVWLKR